MKSISIFHHDGSKISMGIAKADRSGYRQVNVSVYDSKGFYNAGASWKDELHEDDINRQIDATVASGSRVVEHLSNGLTRDHRTITI